MDRGGRVRRFTSSNSCANTARCLLPIVYLMLFTLVIAILAGIAGGVAASNRRFVVTEGLRDKIPAQRHIGFLIDLAAHNASYAAGGIGGIFLAGWIAGRRSEASRTLPGRDRSFPSRPERRSRINGVLPP